MKLGGRMKRSNVGRMLIAIYILAVLAISATARAEISNSSVLSVVSN